MRRMDLVALVVNGGCEGSKKRRPVARVDFDDRGPRRRLVGDGDRRRHLERGAS